MMKINDNGFTILEVLIGIILFLVGLLGVAGLQISAIKGNDFSARAGEATLLAANQMEQLLAMDFEDLVNMDEINNVNGKAANGRTGPGFGLNDMQGDADGQTGAMGTNGRYTVMYNVAPDRAPPAADFARVRVIVAWGDQDAAGRSISIDGVRAD